MTSVDNPICVPMRIVWEYHPTNLGVDYSVNWDEARATPLLEVRAGKKFYIYENAGPGRTAVYRLETEPGQPFAYSYQDREGQRHGLDRRLGYVSDTKKEGMVPFTLPRHTYLKSGDSRYQTDFRDGKAAENYFAYPAFGFYHAGQDPDGSRKGYSTSKLKKTERDNPVLSYGSSNYDHEITFNENSPHIYYWRTVNTATGLDLQWINQGGGLSLEVGEGTGRGLQMAFGFQDFNGYEGIDPALKVCITVHNPTQAGTHSSAANPIVQGNKDNGSTLGGSILTKYEVGVKHLDITVIPIDFIEKPPIGNPASPFPTPPAPCASEHHGQDTEGNIVGLWETLRIRQRIDLDWQGREGVHKHVTELVLPSEVVSDNWQPTTFPLIGYGTAIFLVCAFDEGYVYDPINHSAPIALSTFSPSTLTSGNPDVALCGSPLAPHTQSLFADFWFFSSNDVFLSGANLARATVDPCDACKETLTHFWDSPATDPTWTSQRGGIFYKSRFPAAASDPDDRFGIGIASSIGSRSGNMNDFFGWSNLRALICSPADYTEVDAYGNALQSVSTTVLREGAVGDPTIALASGTYTVTQFLITDTYVKFQGHVDWLEAGGYI